MKVTLETVGDYIELYNLFSKRVKEMTPKEIKKILTDKDHKYHYTMDAYKVALIYKKTLTKKELEKVKDENHNSFLDRIQKEDEELSTTGTSQSLFERMVSSGLPDNEEEIWVASFSDKEIENLMFKSCETGDLEVLETIIKGGVEPHICDNQNFTPLFAAAENGQAEAVKILVENGAKVNHMTSTGDTPLHAAVLSGNIDTVEELVQAGADQNINNQHGLTPLQTIKSLLNDNSIDGSRFEDIAKYLERKLVKTKSRKTGKTKEEELPL